MPVLEEYKPDLRDKERKEHETVRERYSIRINKLPLGAKVTSCLIIISFLILVFSLEYPSKNPYEIETRSSYAAQTAKNIPSEKFDAQVALSAYVGYNSNKSGATPKISLIPLHHMSTKLNSINETLASLVVETNFATITLQLLRANHEIKVEKFIMAIFLSNYGMVRCTGYAPWIGFKEGHHYRCPLETHFLCYVEPRFRTPITVFLEYLEFGIASPGELYTGGQFSNQADYC